MRDFLALIFSPSGYVGRGVWWAAQIAYVVLFVILLYCGASVFMPLFEDMWRTYQANPHLDYFRLSPAVHARQMAEFKEILESGGIIKLMAIGFVLLLAYWSAFAIEVKRWHDRGMSGFWYLLRFVPTFLHYMMNPAIAGIITLVIGIWMFVQLGFLAGTSSFAGQSTYGSSNRPQGSGVLGTLLVLLVLVISLVGCYFVVVAVRSGHFSTTGVSQMTARLFPGSDGSAHAESSYHGTQDKNFAKDWVLVDGQKIEGITMARPAAGGKVAILYSDGGKDVPASSLPQGFLDAWNLTPDRLRAADGQ